MLSLPHARTTRQSHLGGAPITFLLENCLVRSACLNGFWMLMFRRPKGKRADYHRSTMPLISTCRPEDAILPNHPLPPVGNHDMSRREQPSTRAATNEDADVANLAEEHTAPVLTALPGSQYALRCQAAPPILMHFRFLCPSSASKPTSRPAFIKVVQSAQSHSASVNVFPDYLGYCILSWP